MLVLPVNATGWAGWVETKPITLKTLEYHRPSPSINSSTGTEAFGFRTQHAANKVLFDTRYFI